MTTEEARGYSADKDPIIKRLSRVEGQIRGIRAMVDDDRYCIDVLTQISAAQAALDKVGLALLDSHVDHCVMGSAGQLRENRTAEVMAAIARLMRRG